MEARDQAALELAIEQSRKEPGRAEQLDWKIEHDGWQDAAEFAAYCRQSRTLRLRPWETPPCWVIDPDSPPDFGEGESAGRNYDGRAQAAQLLREMLALAISRWHPDPRAAIAEAKRGPKRGQGDDNGMLGLTDAELLGHQKAFGHVEERCLQVASSVTAWSDGRQRLWLFVLA